MACETCLSSMTGKRRQLRGVAAPSGSAGETIPTPHDTVTDHHRKTLRWAAIAAVAVGILALTRRQ